MPTKAKVSIIVPVYNTELLLSRCLDTLVNQSLKELEILVVNDGSTDGSQDVIDRFAAQYPTKVVPLIKKNGGLSDARNFGISHATGEYLAFVDSDDWVDLDAYERLYNHATNTDADIVVHPMTNGFLTKRDRRYLNNEAGVFGKSVRDSPEILVSANSFAVNKIYRRSFWLKGNFMFPVGQAFEDSAVIYNILYAANKIELVDIPFYVYERSREDSITRTANEQIYDIFKSCDSILDYFQAKPEYDQLSDSVVYVCLRHIFARFDLLTRSDNHRLVRKFLRESFSYLNKRAPGWRDNSYFASDSATRLRTRIKRQLRRNPKTARAYYRLPIAIRRVPRTLVRSLRDVRRVLAKRANPAGNAARTKASVNNKQHSIQRNGLQLIAVIQTVLDREGIRSFADFGTLLGLVREGHLLKHDLDVDMGVLIDKPIDLNKVRTAMERFGFKVTREYFKEDQLVESSFQLWGVKVDLNYYQVDDSSAKTWLFYRDPAKTYPPQTRDIVEMSYSPIVDFKMLEVQGAQIRVPTNAEKLLEEKYGASWKTPDKGWIYWQSPAAVPIETKGKFVVYNYIGGFTRSDDVDNKVLYEKLYLGELIKTPNANKDDVDRRKLQSKALTILREVDRVCRDNDLTYYLAEGTLLGAIRHEGFIPWDDDIDISMPRPDYEKFLRIAPGMISSEFEVQYQGLLPKYWAVFTKVRMLDTTEFHQPLIEHLTLNNGPCIDIFPLDSVPEKSSRDQVRQKELLTLYRRALFYKRRVARPKSIMDKVNRLRTFVLPVSLLYRKTERVFRMLEHPDNSYLVNLASSYSASRETFPVDYYGTPRMARFEDGEFPVPEKAEAILQGIYGPNFRTFPDLDVRSKRHATRARVSN